MQKSKRSTLTLTVRPGSVQHFITLFQRGFLVPCEGPIALYDLLLGLPGFDRPYISDNIETIFVNGVASDSLERLIFPGNTIALSSAMPGLAGAIFRKEGAHASLRSKPVTDRIHRTDAAGFITVKLFNLIAMDRGKDLLTRGILIKGSVLARFFRSRLQRLGPLIASIHHDATAIPLEDLRHLATTCQYLLLEIHETFSRLPDRK